MSDRGKSSDVQPDEKQPTALERLKTFSSNAETILSISANLPEEDCGRISKELIEMMTSFTFVTGNLESVEQEKERLLSLSTTDMLTGLLNRNGLQRAFLRDLSQFKRDDKEDKGERFLVFLRIDLDGFKGVNDTLGHHVGDKALVDGAAAMKRAFRESDILARDGGDELAVVIKVGSVESYKKEYLIEKTRELFTSLRFWGRGGPVPMGASIGVSYSNEEGFEKLDKEEILKTMMERADKRMYEDKKGKEERLERTCKEMILEGPPEQQGIEATSE